MWPDYAICWAYDGTTELAGYVGAELPPYKWDKRPTLRLARDRNALCHLVSVVDATRQVRMWPLWWHLSQAWHGPALLDKLPGRGVGRLTLSKIPEGGVHIDLPRKAVGGWQTADTMGILQATRGQSGRADCQTRGSAGTPRTRSRGERRCRRRLRRPSPRGGVGPLRRRVQSASGIPCGISLSSARTGAHHCIMMH